MRLFIAINFDEETKQNILAVQQRLQELGQGNFSRPENLHLTLVFLGEVEPARVAAVHRAMGGIDVRHMGLTFDRVGRFNRDGGDIWWIGLTENRALLDMQKALSDCLTAEGFQLESRRFSPHITLAREARLMENLDCAVLLGKPFSTYVNAVSLMRSERINGKLTYTEMYRKE